MFTAMTATAFDPEAPLGQRRAIIRCDGDDVEMVEAAWGLRGPPGSNEPFTLIRAEGRSFPTHRYLVPASDFRLRSEGRAYSFSLADDDWFYLAGIWRPAKPDWPEAYVILTVEANADVAPYNDRQMVVLRRERRFDWLDGVAAEGDLLHSLPAGSFRVKEDRPLNRSSARPRSQTQSSNARPAHQPLSMTKQRPSRSKSQLRLI